MLTLFLPIFAGPKNIGTRNEEEEKMKKKETEVETKATITAERDSFWNTIAYREHVVHIYDQDQDFVDSLFGFVHSGFKADESVIVIATRDHLKKLDAMLRTAGHDLFSLRLRDQYISLDATQALSEFMINRQPDGILFRLMAADLMKRAKRTGRKVRAFGEMVAILWANGNSDGTMCLENLWSEYMEDEPFSLFCAYPRAGFGPEQDLTISDICKAHTHEVFAPAQNDAVEYRITAGQQTRR